MSADAARMSACATLAAGPLAAEEQVDCLTHQRYRGDGGEQGSQCDGPRHFAAHVPRDSGDCARKLEKTSRFAGGASRRPAKTIEKLAGVARHGHFCVRLSYTVERVSIAARHDCFAPALRKIGG